MLEQWVIAERQMKTAQALCAVRGHTGQMNVEHGLRMWCGNKIAVEPFALGLFGAQQEQMICDALHLLPGKLIPQEQIKELVRCNHDLNLTFLRFFGRNLVDQKLRFASRTPEARTK